MSRRLQVRKEAQATRRRRPTRRANTHQEQRGRAGEVRPSSTESGVHQKIVCAFRLLFYSLPPYLPLYLHLSPSLPLSIYLPLSSSLAPSLPIPLSHIPSCLTPSPSLSLSIAFGSRYHRRNTTRRWEVRDCVYGFCRFRLVVPVQALTCKAIGDLAMQ